MYCEKYVEMGRKIRYYRIMQELGQGMLAEQIGITPQYLSKIEHGSARPSMDLVFRGVIFIWRYRSQKWTQFRLI